MRRDWGLIRDLLIDTDEVEASPDALDHHMAMLRDAGHFDAHNRLTMKGADLADLICDPIVWAVCQKMIEWNGGGLPEDLLRSVACGAREQIKQHGVNVEAWLK